MTQLPSILRPDVSSSFSDLWYRVGPTRPRLASHAQLTPQVFGERRVHVVEDPAGGGFYRVSEAAYAFIGLLDGRCTVDEAWKACCVQLGDDAPTQKECIDVLSRLQYYGLLSGDQPLAADMIGRRMEEIDRRRRQRRWGGGLSVTLPLFNPDRVLGRIAYLLRPLFGVWGLAIYLLTLAIALLHLVPRHAALADQFAGVLDPTNLVWMGVIFILLRAWHEFGHAAACKALGGRCTEVGLMLVAFLFPFPYCDASSAWRFPSVRSRVIVSAAGMLFETFVAALAAILWSHLSNEAASAKALLFNVMLISGVTTIVFNANPLLRYDGYYILSDLTGLANLAQRSMELSRFLLLRRVFKVASVRPPAIDGMGQFWLLTGYHLLATPYRLLVTATIVLALWTDDRYLTVGAVIAVVAACVWLVWPALKGLGFLIGSPTLLGRRARAATISAAAIGAVLVVLLMVPLPSPTYATGTLEPVTVEPIRPREDGFVERIFVTEGQAVRAGDAILQLRNDEAHAESLRAQADLDRARAASDAAAERSGAEQTIARFRVTQATETLARATQRVEALMIRAERDGRICPPPSATTRLADLEGRFVAKGTLIGLVSATDRLVVRCLVSDRDHAYIFGDQPLDRVPTTFRVKGAAGDERVAVVTRATPAATVEVAQASLTTLAGGEVQLDPSDPDKRTSLTPQFTVELAPTEANASWQAGLRTRVRFETPSQPLAATWWRKARQYLSDRTRT